MENYSNSGRYSFFTPAIKVILIINAVLFIFSYVMESYLIEGFSISRFLYQYFALFPIGDMNPYGSFYPWQLLTYQFMHANISHIFFNLFSLWMFGPDVERAMGTKKFAWFYILCGIGAGLIQLLVMFIIKEGGITVGASGAIYGVLVAFAVFNPDRRVMIIPIPIPIRARTMVIMIIILDSFLGLTSSGNVAHFAHLGGALFGFLLAKYGDKLKIYRNLSSNQSYSGRNADRVYSANTTDTAYWQRERDNKQYYPPTENPAPKTINKLIIDGEDITQQKIDEILDKISEAGYASLTEREKKILVELSNRLK